MSDPVTSASVALSVRLDDAEPAKALPAVAAEPAADSDWMVAVLMPVTLTDAASSML